MFLNDIPVELKLINSSYLSNAINYDRDLFYLGGNFNKLLDEININTKNKILLCNFLSNLVMSYNLNKPLSITKNRNDFKIFGQCYDYISYRKMISMIDMFKAKKLIVEKPGIYTKTLSYKTRILPSDKLVDMMKKYKPESMNHTLIFQKLIVLKDSNKKEMLVDFDNPKISKINMDLKLYNDFISNQNIDIPPTDKRISQNTTLRRTFNNSSLDCNGRFYGAGYQGLDENERKQIKINDSSTLELDYKSSSLRAAYHLSGIDTVNDPYMLSAENDNDRDLNKSTSMILLNSGNSVRSKRKAFYVIKHEYSKIHKIPFENVDSKIIQKHRNKFLKAHNQISHMFYADKGLYLSNYDANIASNLIKEFSENQIPLLCIHDSFIVEEKYKDKLYQAMDDTYKKQFGFSPVIH